MGGRGELGKVSDDVRSVKAFWYSCQDSMGGRGELGKVSDDVRSVTLVYLNFLTDCTVYEVIK